MDRLSEILRSRGPLPNATQVVVVSVSLSMALLLSFRLIQTRKHNPHSQSSTYKSLHLTRMNAKKGGWISSTFIERCREVISHRFFFLLTTCACRHHYPRDPCELCDSDANSEQSDWTPSWRTKETVSLYTYIRHEFFRPIVAIASNRRGRCVGTCLTAIRSQTELLRTKRGTQS